MATKPDGDGGAYVLYVHQDHTVDLWHRVSGHPTYCPIGNQIMWRLRRAMAELGITEDGWLPS